MQKQVHVDCPTYLELGLKNGHINTVNGKELNLDGVNHVINYLCKEVDVDLEDVKTKVKTINKTEGSVILKLFNGAVSSI